MSKSKRSLLSRAHRYDMRELVCRVMEEINTARSLSIWLCFKYDQSEIVTFRTDPLHYADSTSFAKDYFATRFLSKFDSLRTGIDTKDAAFKSFIANESICAATNRRLKSSTPRGDVGQVLHFAVGKIADLLPPLDSSLIDEVFDLAGFGPGVSSSCKGDFTGIFNKHASVRDITPELAVHLFPALNRDGAPRFLQNVMYCYKPGNALATVPKDSKTDRMIAVEPHINMYVQKGVGSLFRRLLRKWRVNLNDQSKNQKMAMQGSVDGRFSTLDLRAASDTICTEVVRTLLPSPWVQFLDTLRSHRFERNGEFHTYQKHSSMGNGYTFELESLIFSSLILGVYQTLGIKADWSCYGDDIIVVPEAVPLLIETLSFCGFTINPDKSFTTSPFRESCGADGFNGDDVTPFYFKRGNDVIQLITFANWLRSDASRRVFQSISKIWTWLYLSVPKGWALKGPSNSPLLCFHVTEYEADPEFLLKRRPYGPLLGYKLFGVVHVGAKYIVQDSLDHMWASIAKISSKSDDILVPEPYTRESHGRARGRWVRKAFVFDEWPSVRG